MKTKATLLALPLATLVLLAGCGGDDSSSDSSSTDTATGTTQTEQPAGSTADQSDGKVQVLELQAEPDGQLAYVETSLNAKAGPVEVDFTNDSSVPHDVVFEKDGKDVAQTDVITNSTDSTEFDAVPPKYTYYCSVPGHREAGMEGTLTVK